MDLESYARRLPALSQCVGQPEPRFPCGPGATVLVGRVVTPQAAIAVGRYLLVNPVTVWGPEIEGATASLSVETSTTIPVYLVGPGVAKPGDMLICRFLDHRWVADRMATRVSDGIVVTGCPCSGGSAGTTPATLFMHVTHPELNFEYFRSCTLEYQPTPAVYAPLGIGANNHFSRETFVDSLSGESFRYLFRCELGLYVLRMVFAVSAVASPAMTAVLYQWLIGFPGNHCGFPGNPFLLSNGRIHQTGDARTVVTINTLGS
ncbi:MAG: hypothetical protein U0794_16755 [Isosphaeraceae bacterium]